MEYRTNGCTGVPDFDWKDCCDQHDRDYQDGGGWFAKFRADWRLAKCIGCKRRAVGSLLRRAAYAVGHVLLGGVYFVGVRVFGSVFFHWSFSRSRK